MQHGPTCHDDLEMWTGSEQIRYQHGGTRHLLEIVQQEQDVLISQICFQQVEQGFPCDLFDVKRLGKSRHNKIRIAERSQVYEIHPIGEQVAEFCCYLQTQTRFACATGTRQGHEAHVLALKEVL